jgi:hypothetical protein
VSLLRRATRRDKSEPGIVRALTALGCSVQPLVGKGVPDLLVGCRGVNILLEVKSPPGPNGGVSGRVLNEDQRHWHATWLGAKPYVVRTTDDAIAAVMSAAGIQGQLRPVPTTWDEDALEPIETHPGQCPEASGFTK